MPYIQKTTKVKNRIYVEKVYSARYGKNTIPGEKKKKTREVVKENQQRQRIKKLSWLIEENFGVGDWHIVLTFRKEERTNDKEKLKEIQKEFMKGLRKAYKDAGVELKYIKVIEHLRSTVHYHMIINDFPGVQKQLLKLWKKGRVNMSALYESEEQFKQLASYLVKEMQTGEKEKGEMSYTHSRNLVVPETKVEIIKALRWRKEPKAKKGYYVEKSSVYEGVDSCNYTFQYYTLVRYETEKDE